jgi:putative sterol carrier protein
MEGVNVLHLSSYALTLKTFFRREQSQGINETYELQVDDEILQVQINDGEIDVKQGEAARPDAIFHTDVPSYLRLLTGQIEPGEALSQGLIQVEGDPGALSRFLGICGVPRQIASN